MLETQLQASVLQEATEHLIAKPLLLCLGDKSEACREAAINMLVSLLQVHDTGFYDSALCLAVSCANALPYIDMLCYRLLLMQCLPFCRMPWLYWRKGCMLKRYARHAPACIQVAAVPASKLLPAALEVVWAAQASQGEPTEELRVQLLHLMTEIIAQAGKVQP